MKTTYSMADAARILSIKLPTTANALKSAFRRRSREVHPDHSIAVDAKEQFQLLSAVYDFAQKQPDWLVADGSTAKGPSACVDGTPLSELGKGRGPTENGKPCKGCDSKGFTTMRSGEIPCPDCRPSMFGFFSAGEFRCRRCGGDGVFKRNGKAVGQCNGCRGAGWIRANHSAQRCHTCRGTMYIRNPNGDVIHHKCSECKGCGELLVFNPVIPKGLLRA